MFSQSTTMRCGEEPPIKRVRRFLMLPDDLLLNCLARVSRVHYPTLSLVSKKFRSLLASTELYQTRILLGRTESCLYICLRFRTDSKLLRWFILCRRPNRSTKVLVPISSPNSTSASLSAGVVVVGPNIYSIGGGSKNNALSSVMVMDSRSHTWREAPSMQLARMFPSVCTLDGKIYVIGGCDNLDSMNWIEIFDTKTQTWEFLQIPSEEVCRGSEYRSVIYEGTVYVRSEGIYVTYKLHKGRWREADIWILPSSSYCIIENVFYCYSSRKIYWYKIKKGEWPTVKGLEGLPCLPFTKENVKLVDHGGKLAILWEQYVCIDEKKTISCAEIAIEKRQNGEIWGTVESFDNVFISNGPNGYEDLVDAFTATVW